MGITWGVWISPAAQRRASWICLVFGVGLAVVGLSALTGGKTAPLGRSLEMEEDMYEARVSGRLIDPQQAQHKRWTEAELKRVREEIERQSQVQEGGSQAATTGTSPQ
jgi:succinate dehydrogenase / fumarate reductase cytochrome b subunit